MVRTAHAQLGAPACVSFHRSRGPAVRLGHGMGAQLAVSIGSRADPESQLRQLNRVAIERSAEFFAYEPPRDFIFEDDELRFTSAVETPYAENNLVRARYFPAKPRFKRGEKAVVLLPHWNSHAAQHVALCRAIAELGISVLRISLPYHDRRMPAELTRADYAVSANVARTLDATRQAVIDVRSCSTGSGSRGFRGSGNCRNEPRIVLCVSGQRARRADSA